MTTGKLQVHSENILPIIKQWLYSEKDIFVRELVSNACDAIAKVCHLQDRGECPPSDHRVEIRVDKQARTITFSDTGIGMDAGEVEKYLAQIAFSGASEFIKAYEIDDPFIGHFGLGFYSAYMIADRVEVQTRSYRPDATPVLWRCDGSSEYELQEGTRSARGTDIILYIGAESDEYLEPNRLAAILQNYCAFMPCPIFFNDRLINSADPLWLKPPAECTPRDYLNFYKTLYPLDPDPLFWIHLNVDYPFHLKGILYFPHLGHNFDINKSQIKLFSNRVFVSDNCKDILPEFLSLLKGAIDSPDIPLNVSRSHLQVDKNVRQLASHITKKVADALGALYSQDRERFLHAWPDCEVMVKLGILHDDAFYERCKKFVVWKTTQGSWLTIDEYLERNKEKSTVISYITEGQRSPPLLALYENKGIDVLIASTALDSAIMAYLEKRLQPHHFQRIDASVQDHLVDNSKEKTILDASGRTEGAKIEDFVRASLQTPIAVQAKSLTTDDIPAFIVFPEQERRLRDYLLRTGAEEAPKIFQKTLVVNTNSPLVNALYEMRHAKPDLACEMARQIYDLSLLAQQEMEHGSFIEFLARSNKLLLELAKQAREHTA